MLQPIDNQIKALLGGIDQTEAQQFHTVASSVLWMATQAPAINLVPSLWEKNAAEQSALHRLTTRWQDNVIELPEPVYQDYADVVFLLARAKLDFYMSDAYRVSLSQPLFHDEIRYAGMIVAANNQDRAVLYSLLNINLSFTELLSEVLSAAMYAHNVGSNLAATQPQADDRCAVDFVLTNVRMTLKHFPFKQMLPKPESQLALKGVRYSTVGALASVALRHINR